MKGSQGGTGAHGKSFRIRSQAEQDKMRQMFPGVSRMGTQDVEKQVEDLRKSHAAIVQRPVTSQNALIQKKGSALHQAARIQQQKEMAFGGYMMRPASVYDSASSIRHLAGTQPQGAQHDSGSLVLYDHKRRSLEYFDRSPRSPRDLAGMHSFSNPPRGGTESAKLSSESAELDQQAGAK